jgi:hypothetical protein
MEKAIEKTYILSGKRAEPNSPIFREEPSSFTLPPGMSEKHLAKKKSKKIEQVIDLTELEHWPREYFDVIASDLTTAEQRADMDREESMCGPIGRLKMMLGHRGIPRKWVVEYGWPRVLDKIREYAADKRIRLIEPENYDKGNVVSNLQ